MNVAELRLVAIVQEQLIVRTAELEKQRDADLSQQQKSEYEQLQTQQAELADWVFKLSEPDDAGPEDRPEDFVPKDDPDHTKPDRDPESIDELLPSLFGEE